MMKIEDYALLGDLHTAAVVSKSGSVDWLCLPRSDSAAAFAALLHNEEAGHWTLAPVGASTCTARRYAPDTLVLETDWVTADGAVRVIDFMPLLLRNDVGLLSEEWDPAAQRQLGNTPQAFSHFALVVSALS